jgi:hypothetical protein
MILVVPAGTFRLSGSVLGLSGWPLEGALVQVTAGIGAGLSSSTVGGVYRLYGVAGDIQVMVSEPSYMSITQAVTVNSNANHNFDLATVDPPPDLAGTYTLRIAADPACPTAGDGALPAIGREREYTAMIQPSENGIRAGLSGADFLSNSKKSLSGHVTPNGATFYANDPSYYYSNYPDLAELLPGGYLYLTSGTIDVTRSGNDLVGTLNGTIKIIDNGSLRGHTVGQCTSAHHPVTFMSQSGNPARTRLRR